ncbi:hypothetical protein F5146DRAFT_1058823, partial [Armillaria mellea]
MVKLVLFALPTESSSRTTLVLSGSRAWLFSSDSQHFHILHCDIPRNARVLGCRHLVKRLEILQGRPSFISFDTLSIGQPFRHILEIFSLPILVDLLQFWRIISRQGKRLVSCNILFNRCDKHHRSVHRHSQKEIEAISWTI